MSTAMVSHQQALVEGRGLLEAALPSNINVGDFVRLALTEIQRTPALQECSPDSVFLACMEAARLGAVPGTLGHGWLIPRNIKGRMTCNFHPGYRLFVDLARRSGEVSSVEAHVVYEHDEFDLAYGTEPRLVHKPNLTADPGEAVGAYAVAHLKTGGVQVEFMPVREIEKARAAGMNKSPAWANWWSEMAKKVVLKRASKLWPLAVEDQRALDSLVRVDTDAEVVEPVALAEAKPLTERVQTFTDDPADDQVRA